MTITGTGFMCGAALKLVAEDGAQIAAGNVQVIDGGYLMATLDLTGAPAGTWGLSLTNPDGQTATLPGAFVVTAADFRLAAAPASQTVIPGGRTSVVVTVEPIRGFAGDVDLSLLGAPTGARLDPVRIKPGEAAILDLPVPLEYGIGTHAVTIQGAADRFVHTAEVKLNVAEPATLRVFTTPGGTRVHLDGNYGYLGRYLGQTDEDQPLVVSGLLPGAHVLRLTHPAKREEYLRPILASGVNEVRVQLQNAEDPPGGGPRPTDPSEYAGHPA